MTWNGLQKEILDHAQTPGMSPVVWMPIQTRTEMLTTSFRSNLGLRVYGRNLHDIADAGEQIEQALKNFPDTRGVLLKGPKEAAISILFPTGRRWPVMN